jgi:hypothetical protein
MITSRALDTMAREQHVTDAEPVGVHPRVRRRARVDRLYGIPPAVDDSTD